MVKQVRHIITENERNSIKSMYGLNQKKRTYIFESCITVNGKYFIIQDEVFDIHEQKTIGNLWGSIDVFKTIFKNTELEDNDYTQIKESFLSLPILESQQNLYGLRDILLEFDFLQDTWLGRNFKNAGDNITDFVKTSYNGMKKFGLAISQGEWSNILTLLSKGVKYVLRKLKDAMYSSLGMIVDAVLISIGVGVGMTKIAWGLIVALDVYQLVSNDWPEDEINDPFWLKCLFLGFDILGFVTAGAAAKLAKNGVMPLKSIANSPSKVAQYLEKNPKIKGFITSMIEGMKKVPALLQELVTTLSTKFPKGASFIKSVFGGLKTISSRFTESLQKLLGKTSGRGVSTAVKTGGVVYGVEKVIHSLMGGQSIDPEIAIKYGEVVKNKYKGKDPFD